MQFNALVPGYRWRTRKQLASAESGPLVDSGSGHYRRRSQDTTATLPLAGTFLRSPALCHLPLAN